MSKEKKSLLLGGLAGILTGVYIAAVEQKSVLAAALSGLAAAGAIYLLSEISIRIIEPK